MEYTYEDTVAAISKLLLEIVDVIPSLEFTAKLVDGDLLITSSEELSPSQKATLDSVVSVHNPEMRCYKSNYTKSIYDDGILTEVQFYQELNGSTLSGLSEKHFYSYDSNGIPSIEIHKFTIDGGLLRIESANVSKSAVGNITSIVGRVRV